MTSLASVTPAADDDDRELLPPPSRPAIALTLLLLVGGAVAAVVTGNGIYILGLAGFVVALLVSVVLHEGGHFAMAKLFGMKASQFFVGFGPTLFSRRRGETEYGIKAVPAGGFVKIVGMTPLEEIEPQDQDRAFYKAPVKQKVIVLAAGSTVHFIIAVVLVVGGFLALGVPREQAPAIGSLSACVAPDRLGVTSVPVGTNPCTVPGAVPAPARAAGLLPGDVVTRVGPTPIADQRALLRALRDAPARPLAITVDRGGQTRVLTLTPALIKRFPIAPDGAADTSRLVPVSNIGIRIEPRSHLVHAGLGASLSASADLGQQSLSSIKSTVTEKLGSITKIYSSNRDPAGFVGIVGASRVSGEIFTSQATFVEQLLGFIALVASLNLFVGIFNLLPLLPLDGGHIAVALFEGARDKVKRARGYRGSFQRVSYTKLLPLTYAVAIFFLLFTVALVGADLINPIRLGS